MHVFDPTLDPETLKHMERLEKRGVLSFHQVGLAAFSGQMKMPRYGKSCASMEQHGSSCTAVEVKPLAQMLIDLGVSWVDYLKVDCEEELVAVAKMSEMVAGSLGEDAPETHLFICVISTFSQPAAASSSR